MPEDKVAYIPSQAKRFEISKDPYSRERLAALRTLQDELVVQSPFETGVTLIGSLAKGKELTPKTKNAADADPKFFVDTDSIKRKFIDGTIPDGLRDKYNMYIGRWDRLPGITNFPLDISHIQEDESVQVLMGLKHVEQIVTRLAKQRWSGDKKRPGLLDMVVAYPIALKGKDSILDKVLQYEEAKKSGNLRKIANEEFTLPMVFGLDIGGGMKKYRQAFIKQLQEMDQSRGEELWGLVNEAVRFGERKNEIPENLESQFPATLERAAAYYNPPHKQTSS